MAFSCSICAEESSRICARCTKDACNNHLCEKCLRCSDCCECEVVLSERSREPVRAMMRAAAMEDRRPTGPFPDPEPEPEPHVPEPEPDPAPFPEEPGPIAP